MCLESSILIVCFQQSLDLNVVQMSFIFFLMENLNRFCLVLNIKPKKIYWHHGTEIPRQLEKWMLSLTCSNCIVRVCKSGDSQKTIDFSFSYLWQIWANNTFIFQWIDKWRWWRYKINYPGWQMCLLFLNSQSLYARSINKPSLLDINEIPLKFWNEHRLSSTKSNLLHCA